MPVKSFFNGLIGLIVQQGTASFRRVIVRRLP